MGNVRLQPNCNPRIGLRSATRSVGLAPLGEQRLALAEAPGLGGSSETTSESRCAYPPLLGEPFSGCAGLVDVGGRKASDQASHTEVDPSLALSKMAVTTDQTPVLTHHGKHNPTAEVADLLKLEVQFLVGPEPIVKEGAYRRSTLDEFGTPVQDHILGDVAHHPVEITAIQSLNLLAHKLNQVGRGGLLGHLPASIPGRTQ
jgi:hypothetical protein